MTKTLPKRFSRLRHTRHRGKSLTAEHRRKHRHANRFQAAARGQHRHRHRPRRASLRCGVCRSAGARHPEQRHQRYRRRPRRDADGDFRRLPARHHCAVMITGSHNPPDYNGLKMVLAGEHFQATPSRLCAPASTGQPQPRRRHLLATRHQLPTTSARIVSHIKTGASDEDLPSTAATA